MSDQFNEQISEFLDDEMSFEECEFFVRRLQRDDESRARYQRYQMIGTMLRGEHVQLGADFGRRLTVALDGEPAPVVAARRRMTGLAAGLGIAASIALVALVGFGFIGADSAIDTERSPLTAGLAEDAAALDAGAFLPAGSFETAQLAGAPAPVTGIQYLFHHTNYTSGLSRTIMHSSVVAGSEQDVAIEADPR